MKLRSIIGLMCIIGLVVWSGCYTSKPNIADAVVSIVNYQKTSGGSGVILSSNGFESQVLTNGHVCDVVQNGGFVITEDNKEHMVEGYKKSPSHDICVVYVRENLNRHVKLAKSAPKKFDEIKILGHPALYPTIISYGHISDHKVVKVNMGVEKCDMDKEEDRSLPSCLLFGVKSIVKTFDSVITSATIMPGSSGSGVFNLNEELVGLVFAGRGDFGYSLVVPYEYLRNFLTIEIKAIPFIKISQ